MNVPLSRRYLVLRHTLCYYGALDDSKIGRNDISVTHRLHACYIYLHVGDFLGPMLVNMPYMEHLGNQHWLSLQAILCHPSEFMQIIACSIVVLVVLVQCGPPLVKPHVTIVVTPINPSCS